MPRKLILSEAFQGSTKEVVVTTRVPESLYVLMEQDAKEQGTSIAALSRGLLGFHYLAEHLNSKLKKGIQLTSNDLGLLEGLRAQAQDLIKQVDKIDELHGKTKTLDPSLRTLVEQAVGEVLESRFDEFWNRMKKKGGSKK